MVAIRPYRPGDLEALHHICLKTGDWPSREEDVIEVDVDKLKQELHVKDEDIQNLDQYVVKQERK